MLIGGKDLDKQAYVIAEIGGNHNGDTETVYRMVELAAKAGADAVKFQTYKAETLVHPSVEPLPIVKRWYNTQLERFKSLELDWSVYQQVFTQCTQLGVDFLTTPFDLEILEQMVPHMPAVKIASGDLTYTQLLAAAVATGKPVILSTGMTDEAEVVAAARVIPPAQRALLHCASAYPCPDEQANLRAITTLAGQWPDTVIGFSDHTVGIEAVPAAVALGARIIEKHFTLDKTQVPGDHPLSADPDDLARMIATLRRVETMQGDGIKRAQSGEQEMRHKMRRGLYFRRSLAAGEVLTAADVAVIRPTTAFAPVDLDALVGRKLARSVEELAAVSAQDFA